MSLDPFLISPQELAPALGSPGLVVADVRWSLARPDGYAEFVAGHVPGACFVSLETELSGDKARGPGRHPLPSWTQWEALASRLALHNGARLVIYDDVGGGSAARLWWLARHFGGLRQVWLLDGGWAAWRAAGFEHAQGDDLSWLPYSAQPPKPTGGLTQAPSERALSQVVDRAYVAARAGSPGFLLLDARVPERYEGRSEPIDPRPGHIPHARNAPWPANLAAPNGPWLPLDALRAHYDALGALTAPELVAYCGSGVTACHALFALARLGRADAKLYEGSWSDWSRDPSLPATLGPDP